MSIICKLFGHKYVIESEINPNTTKFARTDFCVRCGKFDWEFIQKRREQKR